MKFVTKNLKAMNRQRVRLIAGGQTPQQPFRFNPRRALKAIDPYCVTQTDLNASVDSFSYFNYRQPTPKNNVPIYNTSDSYYGFFFY